MSKKIEGKDKLCCSFCGKTQEQVRKFIVGPNDAYICDECIELCYDIIEEELMDAKASNKKGQINTDEDYTDYKPKQIREYLDQYVIGQDTCKKALSVAIYNHYKRINSLDFYDVEDIELQKSNILLVGPTGVGKTFLAQTLARLLNVPFAIADATALTEAGYVGEDVENILLKLIQAADGDVAKAERGIIYVDEIDKVSRRSDNPSITRDVSGEGVQQALLKILEGTIASVPPQGGRKHPHQDFISIDTNNILFICGGAFEGIEKIIQERLNKKVIGFGAEIKTREESDKDMLKNLEQQDLHKYGLIPELIGRLPVVVTLENLDEAALISILTEPKNSLVKQYQYTFELDNVILEFEEDALVAIAKKALARKTGARGLRAIMETFMRDIMYEIPSDETVEKVIINTDTVENNAPPMIIYNAERKPITHKKVRTKSTKRSSAG